MCALHMSIANQQKRRPRFLQLTCCVEHPILFQSMFLDIVHCRIIHYKGYSWSLPAEDDGNPLDSVAWYENLLVLCYSVRTKYRVLNLVRTTYRVRNIPYALRRCTPETIGGRRRGCAFSSTCPRVNCVAVLTSVCWTGNQDRQQALPNECSI